MPELPDDALSRMEWVEKLHSFQGCGTVYSLS